MKVLIVDDNEFASSILSDLLRDVEPGVKCARAFSAAEAKSLMQKHLFDVIFLDIEMPETNGLELAQWITSTQPASNIVFVTGHSDYALEAHGMYPSGYLLKPVEAQDLRNALDHLRYPIKSEKDRIRVQCFGNFEVFVDDRPVKFKRSKAKEVLAYLIDRRGATCTMGEMIPVLWEKEGDPASYRAHLRTIISSLKAALAEVGISGVIERGRGSIFVNCDQITCDYLRMLDGDEEAIKQFSGQYMNQYSWAEPTVGLLCGIKQSHSGSSDLGSSDLIG